MKPLRDKMLVKPDEERSNITRSGIVVLSRKGMVDSQAQLGIQCTVHQIGPDVDQDQVKIGDKVLIGEFAHTTFGKYLIISDKDIVGVIQ
jgi:co-chaperonin GroES (HSP10)